MKKPVQTLRIVLLALLLMSLSACGGSKVDWDLTISGAVGNPLTLSYSELTDMPQTELSEVLMEKSMGEDEVTSWSGVALSEVFERAEVDPDYGSVTATAADGYAIEISKDELQGAIVALKRGGEWITDMPEEEGKGPIRLVCPETPANRWVFQLQEIQVNK
jgi:DMSO/TMAO reductase YedYZ molybdopterin-dependent catalytic subunit